MDMTDYDYQIPTQLDTLQDMRADLITAKWDAFCMGDCVMQNRLSAAIEKAEIEIHRLTFGGL